MPLVVESFMALAGTLGAHGDAPMFVGESFVFDANGDLTSAGTGDANVQKSRLVWKANMPRAVIGVRWKSGAGKIIPLSAAQMAETITAAAVNLGLTIDETYPYFEAQLRHGGGFAIVASA